MSLYVLPDFLGITAAEVVDLPGYKVYSGVEMFGGFPAFSQGNTKIDLTVVQLRQGLLQGQVANPMISETIIGLLPRYSVM